MKIILITIFIIVVLRKNFRSNKHIQRITKVLCNIIYYSIQYLVISPLGFILNILKKCIVYMKDDIVYGKEIYSRSKFQTMNISSLPDPNPDDTCPKENELF